MNTRRGRKGPPPDDSDDDEWEKTEDAEEKREAAWHERQEKQDAKEWLEHELDIVHSDAEDWRDLYDSKKVSKAKVKAVHAVIGSRQKGEDIGRFFDRFFAELFRQFPENRMASKRPPAQRDRQTSPTPETLGPPTGGCLILLVALVTIIALGSVALFAK